MSHWLFGRRAKTAVLPFLSLVVLLVADGHAARAADGNTAKSATAATVTIAAIPSQTIKGWGCIPSEQEVAGAGDVTGARGSQFNGLADHPAIEEAVYSLGFTIIRCNLGNRCGLPSGQLNTSGAGGMGDLVAQLEIAKAHGVSQYLLCVWSPPSFMHDTGVAQGIVSFRGAEYHSALRPDQEAAFAAYIARAIAYLKSKGFPAPIAVTVQNEPDRVVPTEGTLYTPTGNPDTDQLCRVMKTLRAQLDAGGLQSTVIVGPDTSTYGHAQSYLGCLFAFLSIPKLNAAYGAFSAHSYTASDSTPEDLADYATAAAGTHKDLWMTQWSLPDDSHGSDGLSDIDGTITLACHLAGDLVSVPNNYWFWRDAWTPSANVPTGRALLSGDDKPIFSKRYALLKKLWMTVLPGWKVRKVTSDAVAGGPTSLAQEVDQVAFTNESGDRMAVLLTNPNAEEKQLTIKGVIGTSATTFCTTASQGMAASPPVAVTKGTVTLTLPARSVALLEAR